MANWIETLTGSLEQKKQYKQYKARLDALPEPYGSAAKAVQRYFMYSEEVDWCLRLRSAGYTLVRAAGAQIWHKEGGSVRKDAVRRDYYNTRSALGVDVTARGANRFRFELHAGAG